MVFTETASFCEPTELTGTVGGTINSVAWSATISGSIDYDAGVATYVIGPTPNDTICKNMEAHSELAGAAGTLAGGNSQGRAQGPGELTRGNFTRRNSVADQGGSETEFEHVVSYPGSGNVVTIALTLDGDAASIDPSFTVEHDPYSDFWIPDGVDMALSQLQTLRATGPGPTVEIVYGPIVPFVTLAGRPVTGSIEPVTIPTAPPPLDRIQVRSVDQISVTCDAINDTLTIVSRSEITLFAAVVPSMSPWGTVTLVMMVMTTGLALGYRQYRSVP